jgi:hypothetical protein
VAAGDGFASERLEGRRRRRLDVHGFDDGGRAGIGGKHVSAFRFHLLGLVFDSRDDVIELLDFFEEVADVQEGVAIEADFDEGRLHAGQHACDFAFVDASD